MVVIPWTSEDGSLRYVDVCEDPTRVEEIPEAVHYPCIANAIRRWNSRESPLFTAKCDIWSYSPDMFDAEDLPDFTHAQASYIDLLIRNKKKFSSFADMEARLRTWSTLAEQLSMPACRCEWTLRPARILSDNRHTDGFATTLYVWGYGNSSEAALGTWASAVQALIPPVLA